MRTHGLPLVAIVVSAALAPGVARAQHEAHQTGSSQPSSAELSQCLRVQPVIQSIIVAATARLEAARVSNSPAEMRAAVDHLEAALRDIRTQLAPCSAAGATTDPHTRHTMPGMQQPAAGTTAMPAGAADPHAGHAMPSPPGPSKRAPAATPTPGKPPAGPTTDPHAGHATPRDSSGGKSAPATKRTEEKPDRSKTTDPHAGHPSGQQSDRHMDPVNGLMVDPATAPKTTYQGQTYYFSSEQSRKEFLANPAKFAKKPKQ